MAKIMIVDDNPDISETLKTIMELEKHEAETASSGEEFLNKVENAKPDLVLLDVMMPGLKTKEILVKLKEKGLKNLKIILVTVVRFSDEERKILMTESNIKDYITKPFDLQDIVSRVRKHLD
ncbi:MAG: response regulator receiver domain-containing protein [Candidatus Methanoperedens nitroreducens]|uniref:Response regulator receiver domain-containing protein n=1 Tax=Candidatus Methanoperedens nitratireducens TaxID=1392998 RepID=A0A0P8CJ05_9EURY|nr:response regulator transcription factor [Candidatus Methanoperedens sp. BLZ2]KAB2945126.1 MAG: response regulator transcription factor [Candidatus Methanoperedens sp.]KPQ42853.1 MAG: response regulator receiver domain-containing protein [Candidatus Methanoperedens sp. BLZ1]MBZ0176974.1 response regulator transcription factor [Candidatus Methanoperedens nitroreducens]CAG1003221.1 Response regulator MprA [Methanosarcinales archaeon]MCX9078154.1 response regulator transcription factor [Candida